MIVAMQETATDDQIQVVVEHLMGLGFSVHRTTGERQTILAAVGARTDFDTRNLEVLSGVMEVHRISAPYKLAGRGFRPQGTVVEFANGVKIGGNEVVVMAGPCSVESKSQLFTVAEQIAKAGARGLRGGASSRGARRTVSGAGTRSAKTLREWDKYNPLVISEAGFRRSKSCCRRRYFPDWRTQHAELNLLRELGKVKPDAAGSAALWADAAELLSPPIHYGGRQLQHIASAAFERLKLTRVTLWIFPRFRW
jgi:3-deoxy-7-phosphoheptulonate synthase